MSLAILKYALARTLHRPPSDEELAECLSAMRDLGVERVYVPQNQPMAHEVERRILLMSADGLSVRKIARATGTSKSNVHRVLSRNRSYTGTE